MKYTKKQRNEIYRKALELFYERKGDNTRTILGFYNPYLCYAIAKASDHYDQYVNGLGDFKSYKVLADFEELRRLSPRSNPKSWWKDFPFDYDSRENALLFMIEMTK